MLREELWRAIEGSKISIIVFSKTYSESSWCLEELLKVMECHRNLGQVFLPIFYDVDPSDVRRQKGSFGEALKKLVATYGLFTCYLEDWKRALTEAANLAGWDLRNCRNESKAVEEIVDAVFTKLDAASLPIPDFPVGLESRMQDVLQILKAASSTVCIVGIWGMGGLGKSTLAKAIYNRIHHKFEHKSFIENIREGWEKDGGQIGLQEQLLSDIFKTKNIKIRSIQHGRDQITSKLFHKRALIILDDVNKSEQLDALFERQCESLDPSSVIIITTRNVRLLNLFKVNHVYKMKEMEENESLDLFHRHAFMEATPSEDFNELSSNVVAYCGGLPLALEVLGSYLYDRTKEEWKSVLSKLKRIPDDKIQGILKISYDGLRDYMEQDIFLDICCFFIGKNRAYVTEILNGCDLHADIGITVLIERSLLKVEKNNKLGMHVLLRDMGRKIVCKRSSGPESGSRLWFHEDVLEELTNNIGTHAIQGLALKLQRTNSVCLSTNAFKKMKRLRLLQLDHVQLNGDYGYLSKQLKWVCWQGFPLKYIPKEFYQGNLVAIDLKHSNLKLVWNEPQLLERLKFLNLSHSRYLTNTPNFSKLPNLEKLILKDCPSLSDVHQSIGNLRNLALLNLKDCTSLNSLPQKIYEMESLKTLIFSGCLKIDKLEEEIVQMKSLTTLIAKNTAIKQVPFSMVRSKSIGYISICEYEGLSHDIFPSIIRSWMSPTMNPLSFIHPFGGMSSSPVSMHVQNHKCGDLSQMLSGLSTLRCIRVQCHSEFQLNEDLKGILDNLRDVNLTESEYASHISDSLDSLWIGMGSYHQVVNTLSKSISQGLNTERLGVFVPPGDKHPYWLTCTGEGHSVLFEVPQVSGYKMKGMILYVMYSATHENVAVEGHVSVLIVNHTKCTIQLYKQDTVKSFNEEDWQGIISNLGLGDKVEICLVLGHGFTVKKTTVYLIYGDEPVEGQMEPSLEPKDIDFMRPSKRVRM